MTLRTKEQTMPKVKKKPVWKGPEVDGITCSLLSRFLVCRERFRLLVVEGLKPVDQFSHKLEYGQMWHVCEQALAKSGGDWLNSLKLYASTLCKKYPTQQEQVEHWYNVCKVQFPLYVKWWQQHPLVVKRKPVAQEEVFSVGYDLPSGRRVMMRGKWDSVDLVDGEIWLKENKTKGDVIEQRIKRQLTFDLQTMFYVVALQEYRKFMGTGYEASIAGVLYNVVQRPLSGGKGTIRQHKPSKKNPAGESKSAYYERLGKEIEGAVEPDGQHSYFKRWEVHLTQGDIDRFKRECLNPILENLCDWWQTIESDGKCKVWGGANAMHWRHPFGVYNVLDEGGSSDLDEYLATGSQLGLERTSNLFPELTESVVG